MQSISQSFLLRLAFDKFLYGLQLVFTACLESTGVVENIAVMVREDKFVVDVVLTTLQAGFLISAIGDNNKTVKLRLWG